MNPVTKVLIVVVFILALSKVVLPIKLGILFMLLLISLLRGDHLSFIFLRVVIISGIFLFLIYFLRFREGGLIFDFSDVEGYMSKWSLILQLVVLVIIISRIFDVEEIYAFFVEFRVPAWFIYLIFSSIFLIPRILDKSREIFTSQQVRGFRGRGIGRLKFMVLVLVPLVSSMLYEIEQRTASIYLRGLFSEGKRTHLYPFQFKLIDKIGILICLGLIIYLLK